MKRAFVYSQFKEASPKLAHLKSFKTYIYFVLTLTQFFTIGYFQVHVIVCGIKMLTV